MQSQQKDAVARESKALKESALHVFAQPMQNLMAVLTLILIRLCFKHGEACGSHCNDLLMHVLIAEGTRQV